MALVFNLWCSQSDLCMFGNPLLFWKQMTSGGETPRKNKSGRILSLLSMKHFQKIASWQNLCLKQSSSTYSTAITATYLLQSARRVNQWATSWTTNLQPSNNYICVWFFRPSRKARKKDGVEDLGLVWDCCHSLGHFGADGIVSGLVVP